MKSICFLPSAYCRLPPAFERSWSCRTLCTHNSLGQDVFSTGKEDTVVTLKVKELRGNVIENKGPVWKTGGKAGMSMKTKVLSPIERECC